MSDSDDDHRHSKIKKLTGSNNYRSWMQDIELELDYHDCKEIVKGTEEPPEKPTVVPALPANATVQAQTDHTAAVAEYEKKIKEYEKKNKKFKKRRVKASMILWKAISEDIRGDVENLRDKPKELFDELKTLFDRQAMTTSSALLTELRNMRYDLGMDIDKFFSRMKQLRNQLHDIKADVPAHDMNDIVIKSISGSASMPLEMFRYSLRNKFNINSDFREIIQDIKNFVVQIKQEEAEKEAMEKVMLSRTNASKRGGRGGSDRGGKQGTRPRRWCDTCEMFGHYTDKCWKTFPHLKEEYEARKAQEAKDSKPKPDDNKRKAEESSEKEKPADKKSKGIDSLPKKTKTFMTKVDVMEAAYTTITANPDHHKSQIDWNLDLCASMHVCCNRNYFVDLHPCDLNYVISTGTGSEARPSGMGTVKLVSVVNGKQQPVKFTNVLYVPSFMANLLSVGALAQKGLGTKFEPAAEGVCSGTVFDKDGDTILTCTLSDKIYMVNLIHTKEFRVIAQMSKVESDEPEFFKASNFDTSDDESDIGDASLKTYLATLDETTSKLENFNIESSITDSDVECQVYNVTTTVTENSASDDEMESLNSGSDTELDQVPSAKPILDSHNHIWHCRLGHPHQSIMKTVGHVHGIQKLTKAVKEVCHGCLAGKGTARSRTRKRNTRVIHDCEDILEVVFADTVGPITPESTPSKYRLFQLFVDGGSNYTTVAMLRSKLESYDNIEAYIGLSETMTGRRCKRFKSDNGTEFVNAKTAAYFAKKNIIHEKSSPYTPAQNGKVERRVREVVRKARCMMAIAGAPKSFWESAVNHAAYLINRLPTTANRSRRSPYHELNGYKPDLSRLRVWGCTAYSYVPKSQRKKMDQNVTKCAFLGIEGDNGNYILWDPEKKKIRISDDVLFDEADFSVFSSKTGHAIGIDRHVDVNPGEFP